MDETADLAITARRIAWVKPLDSDQTCTAPDYALAHQDIVGGR